MSIFRKCVPILVGLGLCAATVRGQTEPHLKIVRYEQIGPKQGFTVAMINTADKAVNAYDLRLTWLHPPKKADFRDDYTFVLAYDQPGNEAFLRQYIIEPGAELTRRLAIATNDKPDSISVAAVTYTDDTAEGDAHSIGEIFARRRDDIKALEKVLPILQDKLQSNTYQGIAELIRGQKENTEQSRWSDATLDIWAANIQSSEQNPDALGQQLKTLKDRLNTLKAHAQQVSIGASQ